jgi:hypothetical protein
MKAEDELDAQIAKLFDEDTDHEGRDGQRQATPIG